MIEVYKVLARILWSSKTKADIGKWKGTPGALSQTAEGQIQTRPQENVFAQSGSNMEQPPRGSCDRTIDRCHQTSIGPPMEEPA